MQFAIDALVVIGGLIFLWLIFKLFGGCLLRVLLSLAVLALAAYMIFYLIGC